MIKTLHITAVLAFLLAGGVVFVPIFFGGESDPQIEEFLNSPGVVERYRQNHSNRESDSGEETPPLVRHAQDFSRYLDPPEPEPSRERTRPERPEPNRPEPAQRPQSPRSTAKFSVIGTSYSPDDPEQSRALLALPGEGYRWVRQSQRLEHLMIEQIGDGFVVVQDRSGDKQEVQMEQQEDKSEESPAEVVSADELEQDRERPSRFREMEVRPGDEDEPFVVSDSDEGQEDSGDDRQRRPGRAERVVSVYDTPEPEPESEPESASADERADSASEGETEQEDEIDEDVVRRQGEIMESFVDQMRDSEGDGESREQMMRMLIEQLQAARVSEEEAEGLDDLGKELDRSQIE